MAAIVETIVGDRRIQLGNEEFVRQMGIGTLWGKIRIGLRLQVTGNNATTGLTFLVGVCQGTTDTYVSANTVDYIGLYPGSIGLGGATLSTSALSGGPYAGGTSYQITNTGGFTVLKRTGSTNTLTTTGGSGQQLGSTTNPARTMWFVDIAKGSPNYTLTLYCAVQSTSNYWYDNPSGDFLYLMGLEAFPGSFVNAGSIGVVNTAYSGPALFDTVSVYWNKSVPALEICDLALTRFY